jgi:hypothetical protein
MKDMNSSRDNDDLAGDILLFKKKNQLGSDLQKNNSILKINNNDIENQSRNHLQSRSRNSNISNSFSI